MTITKIEVHGFEEPFIFNEHQPFQEWRNQMKVVRKLENCGFLHKSCLHNKMESTKFRLRKFLPASKNQSLIHLFSDWLFARNMIQWSIVPIPMEQDFSWDTSVRAYIDVYRWAKKGEN